MHYAGINFVDTSMRSGKFPSKSFPVGLGGESSGIVVGLPKDEQVLDDPDYKKRGFVEGAKVAVVRLQPISCPSQRLLSNYLCLSGH